VVKQLAVEKYELLEEINKIHSQKTALEQQFNGERDLYVDEKKKLLEEIAQLRQALGEQKTLFERVVVQNVDLKMSLIEANDTIVRISSMYLANKGEDEIT
jgi:hypothetical protein